MSFARILRSSALMGGAQVVVLAAAFVRAKVIAVILGASGVGLIGIFNAFSGNVASFAGWGLGTSGVRLIAGAPDEQKPAKVAAVRRLGWMLSLLGLGLALLLVWPVGSATFDSSQYAVEMAIVGCAVPCVIAASAWSAILQASGKVASLAKVQIAGAVAGLLLGLPSIWLWGTTGIALSILFAAAVPAGVLWRAARPEIKTVAGTAIDDDDLRRLAKIGGALMVVGWLGQLSAYLVRMGIVRQEGLESAGYFQAAYAISGSLPGFVFAAMGSDFFPRVAAAKDELEAKEVTETQIQAGLLLGVPMIIALLNAGGVFVRLLYADGFDAAIPLLNWLTWGVFVRLFAWPLAFWLMARGSSKAVVIIEGFAAVQATLFALILLRTHGPEGCVIGLLLGQITYFALLTWVARRRSGAWLKARSFHWIAVSAAACLAAQVSGRWLGGGLWNLLPGALAVGLSTFVFLRSQRNR